MIQRIQSVYLTIGLILIGFLGWLPLGEILSGNEIYNFSIKGIENFQTGKVLYSGVPLLILLIIIILIQIAIIFGYKKRILQMRMATFNILLMIGLMLVGWYFVYQSVKMLGDGAFAYQLAITFPLVAAILNYLAIRAIGRDEALVRSIDRIR
jgi:hypothetical protein